MNRNLQSDSLYLATLRKLRAEKRKKALVKFAVIATTVLLLCSLLVVGVVMIYSAGQEPQPEQGTEENKNPLDPWAGVSGAGDQNQNQNQNQNPEGSQGGSELPSGSEDKDPDDGSELPGEDKIVVCIDPGHGFGNSYGALDRGTGVNTPYNALTGKYESDLNLEIALALKEMLIAKGYEVVMVREKESTEHVTVGKRVQMINATNADIMISIHANSFDDPSVKGARVYYSSGHYEENMLGSGKCRSYADAVAKALNDTAGASLANVTVGDHKDIGVIKSSTMPAVLVETCFLTSPEDAALAADPTWISTIASGICTGIERYMPPVSST